MHVFTSPSASPHDMSTVDITIEGHILVATNMTQSARLALKLMTTNFEWSEDDGEAEEGQRLPRRPSYAIEGERMLPSRRDGGGISNAVEGASVERERWDAKGSPRVGLEASFPSSSCIHQEWRPDASPSSPPVASLACHFPSASVKAWTRLVAKRESEPNGGNGRPTRDGGWEDTAFPTYPTFLPASHPSPPPPPPPVASRAGRSYALGFAPPRFRRRVLMPNDLYKQESSSYDSVPAVGPTRFASSSTSAGGNGRRLCGNGEGTSLLTSQHAAALHASTSLSSTTLHPYPAASFYGDYLTTTTTTTTTIVGGGEMMESAPGPFSLLATAMQRPPLFSPVSSLSTTTSIGGALVVRPDPYALSTGGSAAYEGSSGGGHLFPSYAPSTTTNPSWGGPFGWLPPPPATLEDGFTSGQRGGMVVGPRVAESSQQNATRDDGATSTRSSNDTRSRARELVEWCRKGITLRLCYLHSMVDRSELERHLFFAFTPSCVEKGVELVAYHTTTVYAVPPSIWWRRSTPSSFHVGEAPPPPRRMGRVCGPFFSLPPPVAVGRPAGRAEAAAGHHDGAFPFTSPLQRCPREFYPRVVPSRVRLHPAPLGPPQATTVWSVLARALRPPFGESGTPRDTSSYPSLTVQSVCGEVLSFPQRWYDFLHPFFFTSSVGGALSSLSQKKMQPKSPEWCASPPRHLQARCIDFDIHILEEVHSLKLFIRLPHRDLRVVSWNAEGVGRLYAPIKGKEHLLLWEVSSVDRQTVCQVAAYRQRQRSLNEIQNNNNKKKKKMPEVEEEAVPRRWKPRGLGNWIFGDQSRFARRVFPLRYFIWNTLKHLVVGRGGDEEEEVPAPDRDRPSRRTRKQTPKTKKKSDDERMENVGKKGVPHRPSVGRSPTREKEKRKRTRSSSPSRREDSIVRSSSSSSFSSPVSSSSYSTSEDEEEAYDDDEGSPTSIANAVKKQAARKRVDIPTPHGEALLRLHFSLTYEPQRSPSTMIACPSDSSACSEETFHVDEEAEGEEEEEGTGGRQTLLLAGPQERTWEGPSHAIAWVNPTSRPSTHRSTRVQERERLLEGPTTTTTAGGTTAAVGVVGPSNEEVMANRSAPSHTIDEADFPSAAASSPFVVPTNRIPSPAAWEEEKGKHEMERTPHRAHSDTASNASSSSPPALPDASSTVVSYVLSSVVHGAPKMFSWLPFSASPPLRRSGATTSPPPVQAEPTSPRPGSSTAWEMVREGSQRQGKENGKREESHPPSLSHAASSRSPSIGAMPAAEAATPCRSEMRAAVRSPTTQRRRPAATRPPPLPSMHFTYRVAGAASGLAMKRLQVVSERPHRPPLTHGAPNVWSSLLWDWFSSPPLLKLQKKMTWVLQPVTFSEVKV